MKLTSRSLLASFVMSLAAASGAEDARQLIDFVNPFVGTTGEGSVTPAAAWPFGMVQPGPDTGLGYGISHCTPGVPCNGYNFTDTTVKGFSQNHLSGTGCSDLQDVALLPFVGDISAEAAAYRAWAATADKASEGLVRMPPRRALLLGQMDKTSERASPGYYAVTLTNWNVRCEMTASRRVAYHRYTFAKGRDAHLFVNLQSGPQSWWRKAPCDRVIAGHSRWCEAEGILDGANEVTAWAKNRDVAFAATFSPRPTRVRRLEGLDPWRGDKWILDFDLPDGGAVIAKVALSTVDEAGARANLAADPDGFDFDRRHADCRAEWNRRLDGLFVEGDDDKRRQFYTSLYHCYFQPNLISDVTGLFRNDARKVEKTNGRDRYSTFSTWDTVRAAHPLYTILAPSAVADFANSMIDQRHATGRMCKWPVWGRETGCMIALHSVPVVVDAVLKGIPGIDPERAFEAIDASLADRGPDYDRLGYFPYDRCWRSCAVTLEWCLDDWCAARLAERLGKSDCAAFYRKRAGYWKNLFDPKTGYMRGRDEKGAWHEPFSPYDERPRRPGDAHDYVEGSAIQYTWHVMQDPQGLIAAFGGKDPFYRAIDRLFTLPSELPGQLFTGETAGRIGQYAHGNEPSHHVAYFFPFVGHPERTAEIVREICDRYYLDRPDGLCGNDDCGQMSAWFVFACLGFYPFNPCGGDYVIGAPQVPGVRIRLENGRTFAMKANGFSRANKYVKSVTLNGKPHKGFVLRHEDIMAGGELTFEMTNLRPCLTP